MRLNVAVQQINDVKLMLAGHDDDERLLLDTIEGETDALELIRRLLADNETDEGNIEALKAQIESRWARRRKAEARIDARREAIARLIMASGLKKVPLPEATLSARMGTASLDVLSDAAVPDEYRVPKLVPSKTAINKAFEDADTLPNWLTRNPPRPSLTVRRA